MPARGAVVALPAAIAPQHEAHQLAVLDVVTVVREVVDDPAAIVVPPAFHDDNDVGVETTHDFRDVEPHAAFITRTPDAPMRVERRNTDLGCAQESDTDALGEQLAVVRRVAEVDLGALARA